jgi:hypothetical protein
MSEIHPTLRTLINATIGRRDRGVPTLIGDPQFGKTRTIETWCQEHEHTMIRLLLQTMEPETVCGYDVKHPKTGELMHAAPSWLRPILAEPKKKYMIFMDEFDKPREACLSAVLTMLCDRVVGPHRLPETVSFACAMNVPRVSLPTALIERLLFIPFPPRDFDLTSGIKKLRTVAQDYLKLPPAMIPERKKNKGTMHKLESWAELREFWENEDLRHMVVAGLVPANDVAWMMQKLDPKAFVQFDVLSWADTARPADIKDMLVDVLNSIKEPEQRLKVLSTIADRANKDESGELRQVFLDLADDLANKVV